MKTVIYNGPHAAVVTPDGVVFENGKPTEVPEALADSLLNRRDFKLVTPQKEKGSK